MSRIRSIHPGIWTDEDFVSVSMAARLLFIGLLNEADDHGVFEWKPVSLKMRIFPADSISIDPLLSELISVGKITVCIEHKFGFVRNFCRYQRPKSPSYRYVLPEDYRNYVGLTDPISPVLPQPSPSPTEIPPQREKKEEGGRREKESKEDTPSGASASKSYAFESGIIRLTEKDFQAWKAAFSQLDLSGELVALAPWAEQQGPSRWFHAVANALNKRNREIKAAKDKAQTDPAFRWNGIEGAA